MTLQEQMQLSEESKQELDSVKLKEQMEDTSSRDPREGLKLAEKFVKKLKQKHFVVNFCQNIKENCNLCIAICYRLWYTDYSYGLGRFYLIIYKKVPESVTSNCLNAQEIES